MNKWEAAVLVLSGAPSPSLFNVSSLNDYLKKLGIKYTTAKEMTRPWQKSVAEGLGYESFDPPTSWYPKYGFLALIFDKCRAAAGGPCIIRNVWRPQEYNDAVGGAPNSDHIFAHAMDIDYATSEAREKAVKEVLDPLYYSPLHLDMSIGSGNRTTHVGFFTRHRRWSYS